MVSFSCVSCMINEGCFSYGSFLCYDGVAGGLDMHVVSTVEGYVHHVGC